MNAGKLPDELRERKEEEEELTAGVAHCEGGTNRKGEGLVRRDDVLTGRSRQRGAAADGAPRQRRPDGQTSVVVLGVPLPRRRWSRRCRSLHSLALLHVTQRRPHLRAQLGADAFFSRRRGRCEQRATIMRRRSRRGGEGDGLMRGGGGRAVAVVAWLGGAVPGRSTSRCGLSPRSGGTRAPI